MPVLKIRLLGAFETVSDQRPVKDFESAKVRALLAYLAAEKGQPQRREFLAELLWPDRSPGVARANLRNALRNLRSVIGDCSDRKVPAFGHHHLRVTRDSLQLICNGNTWVDTWAYGRILEKLKDPAQATFINLDEAAALYRGPFLDDILLDDCQEFQEWATLKREYFHNLAQEFLSTLVRYYELLGEWERALKYAWRQLELAQWDERAHQQVMRILALQGNRGAALTHFDTCRRVLAEEIGVEPGQTTIDLYNQIRDGRLGGSSAERIYLRPIPVSQLKAMVAEKDDSPHFFVGRSGQIRKLDQILARAMAGSGQVAFVTGDPGTGKTALLRAFTRQALDRYPDLIVTAAQCSAMMGIGDPYLPLCDILALLMGDVVSSGSRGFINQEGIRRLWAEREILLEGVIAQGESLIDTLIAGETLVTLTAGLGPYRLDWLEHLITQVRQVRSGDGQQNRQRLYGQVASLFQALSTQHPLLILLDDLQWVDGATANLLFHLSRRLAGSRVLILGAYRPDEVVDDREGHPHPLSSPLREFRRRYGDTWISLNHQEAAEDRRFVDFLIDAQPNRLDEAFRESLFQRTKGHPLFTLEILRDLQERAEIVLQDGAWTALPDISWERLPARVEAIIGQRLERLDPSLQEFLTYASVEGERFCLQVTSAASGRSVGECQELARKLGEEHRLVALRGVEAVGSDFLLTYQFSHILVRDYLYSRLDQQKRCWLHCRVADALARVHAGDVTSVAGQIAYHYHAAGQEMAALPYWHLAAQSARRKYAYDEAIALYSRALDSAKGLDDDPGLRAVLYQERGLVYEQRGDFEAALDDLGTALTMAEQIKNPHLAWQVLLDLGKLWSARDYDRSQKYWQQSLDQARALADPSVLAGSLNWVGNWFVNQAEPGRALEYHQQALAIFERENRLNDMALTLDLLGIASQIKGEFPSSVAYYDRAIELYRQLDDPQGLAASLTGRGNLAGAGGYSVASIPVVSLVHGTHDLNEALQVSRNSNSPLGETWALWALSLLDMVAGRLGQALARAEKALAIAESVHHREWTIGNLYAMGQIYLEMNALDRAATYLRQALPQAQSLHSRHWINILSGNLTDVEIARGEIGAAQEALELALTPETPMNTIGKRLCWSMRAKLALREGDPALALSLTQKLIASAGGESRRVVIPELWMLQGEALVALGREEEGLYFLEEAAATAEAWGYQLLLRESLDCLVSLYRRLERPSEAENALFRVQNLVVSLTETIPAGDLREGFWAAFGRTT